MTKGSAARALLLASTGLFSAVGVQAQTSPSAPPSAATEPQSTPSGDAEASTEGDILVTARRRSESSISVPVAISAISGEDLQKRGIVSVDALSREIPGLISSDAGGSPQGGVVAIRGISGVDANPFGDQAVSFNIDGVQVARSSVRRLSQMDIAQIDVLKGPQALFFGKNSPAGIISIRTADPTTSFQAKISSSYEFKADETRTEGYVSGPITSDLGFRLAGFYDHMTGYLRNIAPRTGTGIFGTQDPRTPNSSEYAVRGTLKWDPSDRFDARLKVSFNKVDGTSPSASSQQVSCPLAFAQNSGAPENCVADDKVTVSEVGPIFGTIDSRFGDGRLFLRSDQLLGGLELNYGITDTVKLSSITGYYRAHNSYLGNFTTGFQDTGVSPRIFFPAFADLRITEKSQELRLTSDFNGPINFLLGGFYQESSANYAATSYTNATRPTFSSNYIYGQKGTAFSVFQQSQVKFTDTLELSVGARYSYEKKSLPIFVAAVAANPFTLIDVIALRERAYNNLSPEATLTFRPSSNLTIYGGYKEGFLSGGFNATTPSLSAASLPATGKLTATSNLNYDQQLVHGFEGGIKTSLLNGALRTNLSLYRYRTVGLQVAVLIGAVQELRNAGIVDSKGAEFDFSYRTPVRGLTINGALSYLDGTYVDYQAPCYRGLPTPKCMVQVNRFTGVAGLLQDISGTQAVRAPKWSGNTGFDYVTPDIGGFTLGLSGGMSFSDSYFTDVVSSPGGRQQPYQLYNASVRATSADERWEIALIGRNLTDAYYFDRSTDNPFSGTAPGGAAATAVRGDTVAVVNRGREMMVRVSFKFGQ